jgi:hypothetical protein
MPVTVFSRVTQQLSVCLAHRHRQCQEGRGRSWMCWHCARSLTPLFARLSPSLRAGMAGRLRLCEPASGSHATPRCQAEGLAVSCALSVASTVPIGRDGAARHRADSTAKPLPGLTLPRSPSWPWRPSLSGSVLAILGCNFRPMPLSVPARSQGGSEGAPPDLVSCPPSLEVFNECPNLGLALLIPGDILDPTLPKHKADQVHEASTKGLLLVQVLILCETADSAFHSCLAYQGWGW